MSGVLNCFATGGGINLKIDMEGNVTHLCSELQKSQIMPVLSIAG